MWLAYEWTKEKSFLSRAMENIDSFQTRLDDHFVLDHHDIGFLYSLSAVAGYKITGDEHCKQEVIQAADVLLARFQERGNLFKLGAYGDPQYRLIIDSLLNLPLLFEATQLSRASLRRGRE